MAYQAIQSFSAEFPDGRPGYPVTRGEVFPDGHELVRRDWDPAEGATAGGRVPGQLFKKLDLGEEEPAEPKAPSRPARAARTKAE